MKTKISRRQCEMASDMPGQSTVNRKERKHKAPLRPKAVGRRKARFDNAVKSPEQKAMRIVRTRSSTVSSQYATTSEGSNPPSRDVNSNASQPRPLQLQKAIPTSGFERSTPITRRLRPRTRGSASSSASTEVDADREDNGDDDSVSADSSRHRRQSDSKSLRELRDRRAKREALRALQVDDLSSDDSVDQTCRHSASSRIGMYRRPRALTVQASSPSAAEMRKTSLRARSGSRSATTTRSRKNSTPALLDDAIDIDSPPAETTSSRTRSGKAFGDIQERSESSNDLDDDSMDGDDNDDSGWGPGKLRPPALLTGTDADLEGVTIASLLRLRRDQLVQMCEQRNLEVGGTKPQLASALVNWVSTWGCAGWRRTDELQRNERLDNMECTSTTSSQGTARPSSPIIMSAVLSHAHRRGEDTPVLQRKHIHAQDPVTPARSEEDKTRTPDNDLNLDLQELGLEDFTIRPEFLQKLDKIGSGGFKEFVTIRDCADLQCIRRQASRAQGRDIRVPRASQREYVVLACPEHVGADTRSGHSRAQALS